MTIVAAEEVTVTMMLARAMLTLARAAVTVAAAVAEAIAWESEF